MRLKRILVTACLLGLVSVSFSQEDLRERFTFGLKAGLNISNIWDTESENFSADPKAGFAGGAFVSIPLGRLFAIQPEVMFSQKGFRGSGSFLTIPYEVQRTTNHIDIPILFAVRPFSFVSVFVGPQISFLVSQNDKLTFGNNTIQNTEQFENDNWRKNMLGIHMGLDFNIRHFVISPRASLDFQDNKGDGTSSDPRYKNFLIQLTLGYRF
ncbi:MAG TPA: porin family protein [Taishania sp.]|nr:porin family protein [Taishania sp.]